MQEFGPGYVPRSLPRVAAGAIALLALLGALAMVRHRAASPGPVDAEAIVAAVMRGDDAAVETFVAAARSDFAALQTHLPPLLHHERAELRAAACRAIGASADSRTWAGQLVVRASDADWRVRAAAYEALHALQPLSAMPLRDTPMAERDAILLDWVARFDAALGTQLATQRCELYARSNHLQFSHTLAQTCMTCHTGAADNHAERHIARAAATRSCAECHRDIHDEWLTTAHAQSVSHLKLATVNPETRQTEWLTFAAQGIDCAACHHPGGTSGDAAPSRCAHPLQPRPATAASCIDCHREAQDQWQEWLVGDQPRYDTWPPGALAFARGADTRTCIDCHMPRPPATTDGESAAGQSIAAAPHHLAARRDVAFLRSGIDVAIQPAAPREGHRTAQITLTNLAGHDYPTGTHRRAVEVEVAFDDAAPPRTIATLVPHTVQPVPPTATALAPGESRRFDITLPPNATEITCRLTYLRNRLDPETYRAAITEVTQRIGH